MLYNLPDGRTIEISLNDYLELTDEELKGLAAYNIGEQINNPYYGSSITKFQRPEPDDPDCYNQNEIPDVPNEHKILDQDYEPEDE